MRCRWIMILLNASSGRWRCIGDKYLLILTTMGARRSNQSTQTLRLSPRQSNTTAESAAKPHVPSYAHHVLPRKFPTSSTSSAGLLSGLLIYACLAWIFINFSLNWFEPKRGIEVEKFNRNVGLFLFYYYF